MKTDKLSVFDFMDYREFLKAFLANIKERNPQYSLRALAKRFEFQPSFLSEVMSGKRALSQKNALELGRKLQFSSQEMTYFCYLIALESCQNEAQKTGLRQELALFLVQKDRQQVDLQTFQIVSQWECIAILELVSVFTSSNADFFAKTLGISIDQSEMAIENLLKAKLIEKTGSGFQRTSKPLMISSSCPNLALKMYHSAMLEKARNALYEQSPKERYTGTETLMIDPKLLPEAHQVLNDCLDRLVSLFQKSSAKSSLIHVQVNLFELSKRSETNKKKAVS